MSKLRQRWKPGDVIKIPIDGGQWAFGRILQSPLIAFYDFRASEVPPLEEIVARPVAFKTPVMRYAIIDGDFPVIGHVPLPPDLLERPLLFIQDPINGKLSVTYDGGERWPATFEEIEGLERAAVSEPRHIIDRLNDHFAGRPDRWARPITPK